MKFNDSLNSNSNLTLLSQNQAVPFDIEKQLMGNWCWASCTQYVIRYYTTKNFSQQKIVADVLNQPICKTHPATICNQQRSLDIPLHFTHHLNGNPINNPLTPPQIRTELDGGKLICCQMYIPERGGHAVVISSYFINNLNELILEVNDPGDGTQFNISYLAMVNNFRGWGGKWLRTYLTK
jgi:hypothetical protein